MATPDLTSGRPPLNDAAVNVCRIADEGATGVVFANDDIFIRKIFDTNPRKAFELLFNRYYSVLCNHAVRFLYSKQKAEDLVADIFAVFWNRRMYLNVHASYRTYLFAAVRNKCCTYLKWELKNEPAGSVDCTEMASFYPTPEQILEASDLHVKIEQTIIALPPRQQQVFIMSRFEGKTNSQIAKALDLSVKTVEMHISRSLAKFRMVFTEQ